MTAQSESSSRHLKIVTDAACDLPPAEFERYDIHVNPLKILFGEESFRSGVDISHAQFYDRLAHGDIHPTTSQPTVQEFKELYTALGADGSPIFSIHLSEGLSGTVNAARQAARELPDLNITVYDTGTLTSAEGIQVLTAARAAKAGKTVEQIIPLLKHDYDYGGMFFSVDDLSYLHRGGRIGSVRYQVGQVLRIKPVVTVAKSGDKVGTYVSAGRARSLAKAGDVFIKNMIEHLGEGATIRALALYGNDSTIAAQLLENLKSVFNCVYLDMVPTAPVLGVHVGPGALGIGYAEGDWPV